MFSIILQFIFSQTASRVCLTLKTQLPPHWLTGWTRGQLTCRWLRSFKCAFACVLMNKTLNNNTIKNVLRQKNKRNLPHDVMLSSITSAQMVNLSCLICQGFVFINIFISVLSSFRITYKLHVDNLIKKPCQCVYIWFKMEAALLLNKLILYFVETNLILKRNVIICTF